MGRILRSPIFQLIYRGTDISGDLDWSCHAYVPVSQLIYAAFLSKAKGLFPPSDE
jgi:hypothetical protein